MLKTTDSKDADKEVQPITQKSNSKPHTTYLPDLQCRHMWKKVIANEKTKQDKIVHHSFKINIKWRVGNVQLILQIFSQYPNV